LVFRASAAMGRFTNYCVNDGPKLIVIIIWGLCSVGLFAERFFCTPPPKNEPKNSSSSSLSPSFPGGNSIGERIL
jgi:hypothetical protein